jgi:hypothetical protein
VPVDPPGETGGAGDAVGTEQGDEVTGHPATVVEVRGHGSLADGTVEPHAHCGPQTMCAGGASAAPDAPPAHITPAG